MRTGTATPEPRDRWHAELRLSYRRDGGRVIVERRHSGPLVIQRTLYPEGPLFAQNIVIHPPGGIVGGDRLAIDIDVAEGASAQLITPGATRWYRSEAGWAEQGVSIRVATGGRLEWLPQESIVFDAALARSRVDVALAAGASFIGWDLCCLGRTASGETFSRGSLALASTVSVDGDPVWIEQGRIDAGTLQQTSPAGLAGQPVFGTLLACGSGLDSAVVARLRDCAAPAGATAVTLLPGLVVARYRGASTEAARHWLIDLWKTLRPVIMGRPALCPRIWST